MPNPAGLHSDETGDGPRLLLIHGSHWRRPETLYHAQAPLAAHFRLIQMHRRGYGNSTPAQRDADFEPDLGDVLALLQPGAHVLADSYGALLALLAAAKAAAGVLSLTLIEPVAFGLALEQPAVAGFVDALASAMRERDFTKPEQFAARFLSVQRNMPIAPRSLSPEARQSVLAMMSETPPWTARPDLAAIKRAGIPAQVICGGWHPAFDAVCTTVAAGIGAPLHTLHGHGHRPQDAGEPINMLVRAIARAM